MAARAVNWRGSCSVPNTTCRWGAGGVGCADERPGRSHDAQRGSIRASVTGGGDVGDGRLPSCRASVAPWHMGSTLREVQCTKMHCVAGQHHAAIASHLECGGIVARVRLRDGAVARGPLCNLVRRLQALAGRRIAAAGQRGGKKLPLAGWQAGSNMDGRHVRLATEAMMEAFVQCAPGRCWQARPHASAKSLKPTRPPPAA